MKLGYKYKRKNEQFCKDIETLQNNQSENTKVRNSLSQTKTLIESFRNRVDRQRKEDQRLNTGLSQYHNQTEFKKNKKRIKTVFKVFGKPLIEQAFTMLEELMEDK